MEVKIPVTVAWDGSLIFTTPEAIQLLLPGAITKDLIPKRIKDQTSQFSYPSTKLIATTPL